MASLINLPAYQVPNALSFQSVDSGIESVKQNALMQQQMGMQKERLGMDRERMGMERQKFDTQQQMATVQRFAGLAQGIDKITDPAQRQAQWQQLLSQHPNAAQLPEIYRDPMQGPRLLMQEAQGFRGPDEEAKLGLTRAQTTLAEAQAAQARREAAMGGKASLVPVWGKDAQGRDVLLQTRPDGSAVQTQLPPGVSVTGKTSKVDLGTHWGVMDQGGNLIGRLPKDIEGQQVAEARGKDRGQAQVDLPRAQHGAATMVKYIDAILNDRNLPNVTGGIQGRLPTLREASVDTESRIKQVQGGVFLEAFKELKGGGAITEMEGAKAEQAKARLTNLAQSDKGYKEALKELRDEVMALYRIAEQRARGAGPYIPPPGVPTDATPRENTDRLQPSPPGWSIRRVQ